jgi:hypothetical protein
VFFVRFGRFLFSVKKENIQIMHRNCINYVTKMKKTPIDKDEDDQPYDSMSDPDIETDEKPAPIVPSKVILTQLSCAPHRCPCCTFSLYSNITSSSYVQAVNVQKKVIVKKNVPTRLDIKDKIGKLKLNRQRLDLR